MAEKKALNNLKINLTAAQREKLKKLGVSTKALNFLKRGDGVKIWYDPGPPSKFF